MRHVARFGTICTTRNTWKTPVEECSFATLPKVTLLQGCFMFLKIVQMVPNCAKHRMKNSMSIFDNAKLKVWWSSLQGLHNVIIFFKFCKVVEKKIFLFHFLVKLNPLRPSPGRREKINLNWSLYLRPFFVKPFEAPQGSVKIKT